MTVDHPIPYELDDDDADGSTPPVRLLAYLSRGVVAIQFTDGQPFQMDNAEAAALGRKLLALSGQAAGL